MVRQLVRKYRKEFSVASYARENSSYEGNPGEAVAAMNSRDARKLELLVHFGGLASGAESLNGVGAADFAGAVDRFAAHFGLDDSLPDAGAASAATPVKAVQRPLPVAAPW